MYPDTTARVIDLLTRGLVVIVPISYGVRSYDQWPLRGVWLGVITAVVGCVPVVAWYLAWQAAFAGAAVDLAMAASVPLAQLIVLLLAMQIFKYLVGRAPAEFVFHRHGQENSDTLMHGFVLFVISIGGVAVYAAFHQGLTAHR
jgi:hypothetical protein